MGLAAAEQLEDPISDLNHRFSGEGRLSLRTAVRCPPQIPV